ncbi:MAG: bifunctional proline dehydrogenase/L-glutamate gamma-semialdehyde dehydrogenase [Bacteroidaceae bacterium]|nr:bifunctional proline dehydrogenase/L-glutamate gamma-semialdehyde dehydrogenase [Bacteroidaceae bacterium]
MAEQSLPTIEEVFSWMRKLYDESYSGLTKLEKSEQHMYGTMVTTPTDKKFIVRMLDETSQIRDRQKLALRVKELIDQYGIPKFLDSADHVLFWMYQKFAYTPLFNWAAVPIIKWRLRRDTSRVIINAARPSLTEHLATRFDQNIGQNVNLLGEVVLGNEEADKRYRSYLEALKEPDINYISVKISGIYAQTHALNYKECFPELVRRMSELYQTAIDYPYTDAEGVTKPKFINLDMEEYKDAHLTMKLFKDVLSLPQFKNYEAGIVVQAYLPDAWGFQSELLEFARKRVDEGGAPIKMRIVKGCNLDMENIVSDLRGWPNPVRKSKTEVDANYLHIIERGLKPENARVLHIGMASHNLFTISYAYLLTQMYQTPKECFCFEMLEGMANHVWRAQRKLGNHVILYTPVVKKEHFLNAISYLVRRMDENTAPDNFLTHSFSLKPDTPEWHELQQQFINAYNMKDSLDHTPTRTQDRNLPYEGQQPTEEFRFEPDTDFDRFCNQQWVEKIIEKWGAPDYPENPECPENLGEGLFAAANALGSLRADLCGGLCATVGKTIEEADAEVSAAMDYCRYYAISAEELKKTDDVSVLPHGNVEVTATWNAPCSAPVGRIAAALATGNSCTLKADAKAAPVAQLIAQAFYAAGFSEEALRLDITAPTEIQLPEGSKNAIILTAKGDRDHAIMNACHSAFGGAGQKAASCSLLLVERSVFEDDEFFVKLKDCASSLMCGPVWNTGNVVGPMITNKNPRLERALQLDEGERWLIAPQFVDEDHFILRPTVKIQDVARPNSYTFRTPLFAPLLTVAPYDKLDQAVALVNSLGSVASGLQSLDEREQRYWKNNVKVGNLYINRGITGAVVGRQPFGGMKGLASGGPNYLLQFVDIEDKAGTQTDYKASYAEWYEKEFRHARNLHPEIRGEQNIFRYLPLKGGMALRLLGGETLEQVEMVVLAAKTVDTPLVISAEAGHPLLGELSNAVKLESLDKFCATIGDYERIRTISSVLPDALVKAAATSGKRIVQGKPLSNGRIELLRYLDEQSITNEYHRYGSQIEVPAID